MEVPLSWERLLCDRRGGLFGRERWAITDIRLARIAGEQSDEIALQDIADVRLRASLVDRIAGTSTLVVHARKNRRPPLVLCHIRRGAQLAALLEILAEETDMSAWDEAAVHAALSWKPRGPAAVYREAGWSLATMTAIFFIVAIGLHGTTTPEAYSADDALAPNGIRKDRAEIVRFMEREVLPWAKATLGPIKGGPDKVTCETCHGLEGRGQGWQMPAVAALPQPAVALSGWEVYSAGMDAQMRNAIYGYLAESDKQARATYMREVVMPGMAQLLHRPAYDFTRSYDYNRTHVAFGCYHCHRVS
jgi:hypothetical protein